MSEKVLVVWTREPNEKWSLCEEEMDSVCMAMSNYDKLKVDHDDQKQELLEARDVIRRMVDACQDRGDMIDAIRAGEAFQKEWGHE